MCTRMQKYHKLTLKILCLGSMDYGNTKITQQALKVFGFLNIEVGHNMEDKYVFPCAERRWWV